MANGRIGGELCVRTDVHNICVCLPDSEGYDAGFDRFLERHSLSLEPNGPADEMIAEGRRFADFLLEHTDPAWLGGLSRRIREYTGPA